MRGCAQAAEHRSRLGSVGIPLCDELKSLLYSYRDTDGKTGYVLLHCRGHQRINLTSVSAMVGRPVRPVSDDELWAEFGAAYGTVTPFLFAGRPDVRHLVDDTLLARFYAPYTVMTNCGDLEHAVEFHAADVFDVLPRSMVGDIVAAEDKRIPRHALGIVTGNSPESGMLLWEKINAVIRADQRVRTRGDAGFPRTVIDSVPAMGASMELWEREKEVRGVVRETVRGLCEAGTTIIGVACNTTQYFAREIQATCADFGAHFVSMAAATHSYLQLTGTDKFDFLGIEPVADLAGRSEFGPALRDFDVRVPDPARRAAIAELAFRVKREVVSPATVNRLRDLIGHATETDTVVVALTELSILLARQHGRPRSGKRIIDTLDLLAGAMAEIVLEERIATGGA